MEQRLTRNDFLLIIACLIVSAISLFLGSHYFSQAFPEATIDFSLTREEARKEAKSFLKKCGFELDGYRHSAVFTFDQRSKTFLERELSQEEFNAVIDEPVRLWRWNHRWVREQQWEEYSVDITTTGQMVGFKRHIKEDTPGANLSKDEARRRAEKFLIDTLERPRAKLKFLEATTVEHKNRTDHIFTWKWSEFEIKGATYRLSISIQGDRVGGFREFLNVPEAWSRDYDKLISKNEFTANVANFFLLPVMLAMLAIFLANIRRRELRWKTALIFGAVAFFLVFLAKLNNLPVDQHGYDTSQTFISFFIEKIFESFFSALGTGIFIAFLTAVAESMYRRAYGEQIGIGEQFRLSGLRTKRFLLGIIIGLTMTAFFFAYQTVFYIIAKKFGAWSPLDIPYDNTVNTYIPWIMVLLIGFLPAVSEEFIFRAFTIPFLHKYLKSLGVAVFVSAVVWGFAHANYPQQPFFIRGIEVTIGGILIGVVMLRWGIFPALVWHYTIDALYTAFIFLRSGHSYFVISAAISSGLFLLPLAAAIILYLRHRRFTDPTALLNRSQVLPGPPKEKLPTSPSSLGSPSSQGISREGLGSPAPLSPKRLFIISLIVFASLGIFWIDVDDSLNFVNYNIGADQARQIAVDELAKRGLDLKSYKVVTSQRHQVDKEVLKYIAERDSFARIRKLYSEDLRASLWCVRFFREGQKEEYSVYIDPTRDKSVYTVVHLLEEEAPGADLREEEARALAEKYLLAHDLDPATFELKEVSSEKRKERRDYEFIWEAKESDPRHVEDIKFRAEVKLAGDQLVYLWRYMNIPEAWKRKQSESHTLQVLLASIGILLGVAFISHLLWLLISCIRRGEILWSPAMKFGAFLGLITLLQYINKFPTFGSDYPTQEPWLFFLFSKAMEVALFSIAIFLVMTLVVALVIALYPDWRSQFNRQNRIHLVLGALISTILTLVASGSFSHLILILSERFSPYLISPEVPLISGLDTFLPLADSTFKGIQTGSFLLLGVGVAVYYVRRVFKKAVLVGLIAMGMSGIVIGANANTIGEFGLEFILLLLLVVFCFAVVRYLLRNNLLAYVLTGFLYVGLYDSATLSSQSNPIYALNGWIWLALCLLGLLGILLLSIRRWIQRV